MTCPVCAKWPAATVTVCELRDHSVPQIREDYAFAVVGKFARIFACYPGGQSRAVAGPEGCLVPDHEHKIPGSQTAYPAAAEIKCDPVNQGHISQVERFIAGVLQLDKLEIVVVFVTAGRRIGRVVHHLGDAQVFHDAGRDRLTRHELDRVGPVAPSICVVLHSASNPICASDLDRSGGYLNDGA